MTLTAAVATPPRPSRTDPVADLASRRRDAIVKAHSTDESVTNEDAFRLGSGNPFGPPVQRDRFVRGPGHPRPEMINRLDNRSVDVGRVLHPELPDSNLHRVKSDRARDVEPHLLPDVRRGSIFQFGSSRRSNAALVIRIRPDRLHRVRSTPLTFRRVRLPPRLLVDLPHDRAERPLAHPTWLREEVAEGHHHEQHEADGRRDDHGGDPPPPPDLVPDTRRAQFGFRRREWGRARLSAGESTSVGLRSSGPTRRWSPATSCCASRASGRSCTRAARPRRTERRVRDRPRRLNGAGFSPAMSSRVAKRCGGSPGFRNAASVSTPASGGSTCADQLASASEVSGYLVGSPAFKAVLARFDDLGIDTKTLLKGGLAYRRVMPRTAKFLTVRGVFARVPPELRVIGTPRGSGSMTAPRRWWAIGHRLVGTEHPRR